MRSTAAGRGRTGSPIRDGRWPNSPPSCGGRRIRWKPRDIFVAPSWHWQEHLASDDAVLFSFSDRPVQQALGLWREERGA